MGDWALAQIDLRGSGASFQRDSQKLSEHSSVKYIGLEEPVWAGRLDQMFSRDPFQPQRFCDPVMQEAYLPFYSPTNAQQDLMH